MPGEENLDVVESLRQSKIELVVTRHEQPAALTSCILRHFSVPGGNKPSGCWGASRRLRDLVVSASMLEFVPAAG